MELLISTEDVAITHRQELDGALDAALAQSASWRRAAPGEQPHVVFSEPGSAAWREWTDRARSSGLPLCVPVIAAGTPAVAIGTEVERVSAPTVNVLGKLLAQVARLQSTLGDAFRQPCPWAVSVEVRPVVSATPTTRRRPPNSLIHVVLQATRSFDTVAIEVDGAPPLYVLPRSKVCVPGVARGTNGTPFEDWLAAACRSETAPLVHDVSDAVSRSFGSGWTIGREVSLGDLVWCACVYGSDDLLDGIDAHAEFWLTERPNVLATTPGASDRELLAALLLRQSASLIDLAARSSLPDSILVGFINGAYVAGVLGQRPQTGIGGGAPVERSSRINRSALFRRTRGQEAVV